MTSEELQYKVEIHTEPPNGSATKRVLELAPNDFTRPPVSGKKSKRDGRYLILGFDTEFKAPGYAVSRKDIQSGRAKYQVLSYQFFAKISDGQEWAGICCPERNELSESNERSERMTIGQFIAFAIGVGARDYGVSNIPTDIYLVGHFTRADIPAFADFRNQFDFLSSVRSTIVTVDKAKSYKVGFPNGTDVELLVRIRDTMLLTPQASRSLAGIGELVGVPKLTLDADPKLHREKIRNMDRVRATEWDNFKRYAMNDALVCVRYIERIIAKYHEVTGKNKVPITLTSIGVDLLLKSLQERFGTEAMDVLGKEVVVEKYFNKTRGHYVRTKREADLEEVGLFYAFGNEAYHGGRNEQFWFGPCFEDTWTDYDLSSAYPTAMSLICRPRWEQTRYTTSLDDYTPETLGYALVKFSFPESVRYPALPVRTNHGLVFPLSGESFCASPEIALARNLGAKLEIVRGIVIPTDKEDYVFGPFIRECLEYRKAAGSKTLAGLFWKEVSNSTYGKTAQGLRDKRVYDMRERRTNPLPPSRITNPFFAAYITSYVRAVLGEIMNSLKHPTIVFSCTTDGFITNATPKEIAEAQAGPLAQSFARARKSLTGDPRVLEIKHEIRQPLGWRTRGQATLKPGLASAKDRNVVLAKGGIFTPPQYETDEDENEYIVALFFDRTPDQVIELEGVLTGIRDIVEHDADLVEKCVTKRLNMDFDWKRRPMGIGESKQYGHVLFSTTPWKTVEQFTKIREAWDQYTSEAKVCIKTKADFDAFACYVETHAALPKKVAKYIRRSDGAVRRLRQMLCALWHEKNGVLTSGKRRISAASFAATLDMLGIPCKRTDVENGKKRMFVERNCPPTREVKEALRNLKIVFPSLDENQFLCVDTSLSAVSIMPTVDRCPLVDRCLDIGDPVDEALAEVA